MPKILLLAEHNHPQLHPVTASLVRAALQLKGFFSGENTEIVLLVAGQNCRGAATEAAQLEGVSEVWLADHPCYQAGMAENIADLLWQLTKNQDFTYILAPATTYGKNCLPRLAALLDLAQISDVIKIEGKDTFLRPMYAGNILTAVHSLEPIHLLTIRGTAFEKVEMRNHTASAPIKTIDIVSEFNLSRYKNTETTSSARPDLSAARIVVAGGRGLGSQSQFELLENLADTLHAAVGASRAAVDAGFVPNDYQIGQTGKIVAPDLYIAVGISGAIQHLAGMKDSKVIVAINQDPEAPIFEIADYGLVGDLFQILPALNQGLKTLKI